MMIINGMFGLDEHITKKCKMHFSKQAWLQWDYRQL